MNSEGLNGILIKWNKPVSERDYNNLQEGDFTVLNWNKPCSRTDGMPIDFSGAPDEESLEWLMYAEGQRLEGYDYRLFIENQVQRPTNIKDSEFINYNKFLTEYSVIRRTDAEIISAIQQMENEANLTIQSESEKAKMAMLSPAVNDKIANGLPLDKPEQNVRTRLLEIASKAFQNAANAEAMIQLVKSGGTPNLDSGWIYDNLTNLDYPFNGAV